MVGSVHAQSFGQIGDQLPDLSNSKKVKIHKASPRVWHCPGFITRTLSDRLSLTEKPPVKILRTQGVSGAPEGLPTFLRNTSKQFEAHFSMVELLDKPQHASCILQGMTGGKLPIAISYAEGRASFSGKVDQTAAAQDLLDKQIVWLHYVDDRLIATEAYPTGPNGPPLSVKGIMNSNVKGIGSYVAFGSSGESGIGSWICDDIEENPGGVRPWARLFRSAEYVV
ncbi:MAG: hypothetical protein Q9163_002790 [Psora crenata]